MEKSRAIEVLKPLANSFVDYANITMKEEDDDTAEALEMAIEALKAQLSQEGTTKDAISRQAAIDALHMHLMYRMGTDSNKKRLDEWINNLPSAQPEQKKGRWIKVNGKTAINCSACYHCSWSRSFEDTVKRFNFCPNCGADMKGDTYE